MVVGSCYTLGLWIDCSVKMHEKSLYFVLLGEEKKEDINLKYFGMHH